SFVFSRRPERRRPLPVAACVEPGAGGDTEPDTDFLTAVEDRELLSTRPALPPPKELVIPLIPPHRWRNPARPRADTRPAPAAGDTRSTELSPAGAPPDLTSVEAQGVQELLEEARQSLEQPEGGLGPPMSIPLQLPDKDVGTGPLPTPQDYEAVPVAQFGLAMLRGMGWSQGQGIGRTFPKVVPLLEHRPRPRGLGLGAEAAPPGAPKSGETPRGGPAVGDFVRIEAGPHCGMDGKVEALYPETERAVVRLQLGGQVVAVNQHGLRPVSAGASGRLPQKGPEEGAHGGHPPRGGGKRKEPSGTERSVRQRRGAPRGTRHWLRRDLRVRCVDRTFRGGRYYNCKLQIEDLLSPDTCVCRTDDGRLVEGLREASLETVVPRGGSGRVMVVLGKHAGKVGRILEREPERGRALVQLGWESQVLPLPYDYICHFLGRAEED
ncbi:GPKOW protein, partial [Eulacestoma nigropectus]|nr:GPKOW protein [Eulacestoma nigropectus]